MLNEYTISVFFTQKAKTLFSLDKAHAYLKNNIINV